MKYVINIFLLFSSLVVAGQSDFQIDDPIPMEPVLSHGVLENGMTYYIRSNPEPQNRAELMLVVSAGSIDEDDDQKGLAHFAEHMAFNGTKNFPKNELVRYFESIGMEFGPEINAYTSFDETVYMLKIPLDSVRFLEKGLDVLYDWACQISDSDDEIEKERGVIREELRGGRNANFRLQLKWLPVLLHNSKYAERLPIGALDIIENASPETLRRFRNDWYRPDLMAVIVVGDFNQDEMVAKISDRFSQIKPSQKPRSKEFFDIPGHKETLVSIATDPEAQYPIAFVFHKHPQEFTKTLGDYRRGILYNLYNTMINSRLMEKVQEADPPFIMGQSAYSGLFGPIQVYQSVAVCHNGRIEEGLKAVLIENERVKRFGFTETELERQKKALLSQVEKAYNERDQQKSISIAEEYKRNFLMTKEPVPGIENEFRYYQHFMPGITLEEVNQLALKWMTRENRVVVVAAPEVEGVPVPDRASLLALLDSVEAQEIEPYEDAVSDVPLVADEPWPGKVIGENSLEKPEAVEWTLENGARVVVKVTDFKEDEVLFSAWSPGGSSLYRPEDNPSANFAATIMAMSGIAGFDKITLDKMIADKVFSVEPYITDLREGFSGQAAKKDVESMLQMVYLYFTQPRFDEGSFQSYLSRMEGILQNKAASPEAAFRDTLNFVLSNYHVNARPLNRELLKEVRFDRIKAIAEERFRNAADYIFFFVGAMDTAELKPLVEKYIGGIPYLDQKEVWKNPGINPPKGVVQKDVVRGQENKSIQATVFHGDFEYNSLNNIVLDAVSRILSTRLLEVIREEKSGVYSISATPSSSKYPDEAYRISISYSTDPERLEELEKAVFSEIDDFIQNGPATEELEKAKEKMLREREVSLRENRFWMNSLSNTYYLKNGDFSEFGSYQELVKGLTTDSVRKGFERWFDFKNYVRVRLKPAS